LISSPDMLPRPDEFARLLASQLSPDVLDDFGSQQDFTSYQGDPVGFCETILHASLTDDVKSMMESVRDNPITVAVSANATGKSHGAARVSIWFYLAHPNAKVFTAAAPPLDNLKNILWGEIGSVAAQQPELFQKHTLTSLDIRRGPADFLTGVTIPSSGTEKEREAKFAGKHAVHMLFVIDEGDAVPDSVYSGIESCMSGGVKVRLLIMLNPRHASGAAFRMQRDRTANIVHLSAFRHPNVITGENLIPGAVDRETTVRRINMWTRPAKPNEHITKDALFTLPDYLSGVQTNIDVPSLVPGKYRIINHAFSYMVLGRYPAQAPNQLISSEWVSQARSRYDIYVAKFGQVPPVSVPGIMGLDCAEQGDDLNVAVARYGGYVSDFVEWGGVDMITTGSKAVDFYHESPNIVKAYVDATGVGAGVAPHMQRLGCVAESVKVAAAPTYETELGDFRKLRDQIWWLVREWLKADNTSMLPPDEGLIEELLCPTYEIVNGKIVVTGQKDIKEILGRSPNKADGLRMTFVDLDGGFFRGCQFDS